MIVVLVTVALLFAITSSGIVLVAIVAVLVIVVPPSGDAVTVKVSTIVASTALATVPTLKTTLLPFTWAGAGLAATKLRPAGMVSVISVLAAGRSPVLL